VLAGNFGLCGAPLELTPRPLQSCMITTAAKGPGPSGFVTLAGICSDPPVGDVVVIERPDVVPTQPPSATAQSQSTTVTCR